MSKFPSFFRQLGNLFTAAGRSIRQAAKTGDITAPIDVVNKRIKTCQGCEFRCKKSNRCTACGCYLSVKTGLAAEECPKGKWKQ